MQLFSAILGTYFVKLNEYQKGIDLLLAAFYQPTDQLANYIMGQINLQKGNYRVAVNHFTRIQSGSLYWIGALSYLIALHYMCDAPQKSKIIMAFLMERNLSDVEIISVANILYRNQRGRFAMKFLAHKLRYDKNGSIHATYGGMLSLEGNLHRSVEILTEGLAKFCGTRLKKTYMPISSLVWSLKTMLSRNC